MSTDSSKAKKIEKAEKSTVAVVPWNPWLGVVFAVVVFFLAQIVGGFLVSIYLCTVSRKPDSWLNLPILKKKEAKPKYYWT
jgi:hypothetical protein